MRYLYWCIIYAILVFIAYKITFHYFDKIEEKIGERFDVDFDLIVYGEHFFKVEDYGLRYTVMGLFEIILVLPVINYLPYRGLPLTMLGWLLIYYGVVILLRRDVYNNDVFDKVEKLKAHPEEYEEEGGILSYMMIISQSVVVPFMIFTFLSYFFTENIEYFLTPIFFQIVLTEVAVVTIFLFIDKINDLLYKIFKIDFCYEHVWFYNTSCYLLPILPYIIAIIIYVWKFYH